MKKFFVRGFALVALVVWFLICNMQFLCLGFHCKHIQFPI
jgi:hypothetical protein